MIQGVQASRLQPMGVLARRGFWTQRQDCRCLRRTIVQPPGPGNAGVSPADLALQKLKKRAGRPRSHGYRNPAAIRSANAATAWLVPLATFARARVVSVKFCKSGGESPVRSPRLFFGSRRCGRCGKRRRSLPAFSTPSIARFLLTQRPRAAVASCVRLTGPYSGTGWPRSSSRASQRPVRAPGADSSRHWGRSAPRACVV